MSDKPRNLNTNLGLFQGITNRVKLIVRLMGDNRISPMLKLLPIGSLIYLVVPTDLMPFLPFDDAAVIWLGSYLFVELCPPAIVQEHQRAIDGVQNVEVGDDAHPGGDVIDAEFHDADQN
jgi:uncharacterized membrane protein YkvA (DUF1232 family)